MSQVSLTREPMEAQFPSAVCPQELRDRADAFVAANKSKGATMSSLVRVAVDFYLTTHSTESEVNPSTSGQASEDTEQKSEDRQ